jgi:hypothetical protein
VVSDTLLRIFLLAGCAVGIGALVQVGLWTVDPWLKSLVGSGAARTVAVDPVGFIESGKLQKLHGAPAARSLAHRLQEYDALLRRDLTKEYAIVQRQLKISLPEAPAAAGTDFHPVISEPVAFEAKFFSLDIIGIGNFIYQRLYRGDTARALVEIDEEKARYFVELYRPEEPAGLREQFANRTVKGDVHAVLDRLACEIAYLYHRQESQFFGISDEEFCEYLGALGAFQAFVIETAAAAEQGEPISPDRLDRVIDELNAGEIANSGAPILHVLRASLYKLRGDLDSAIEALKKAQKLAANDPFVVENLPAWLDERQKLQTLGAQPTDVIADPLQLAEAFQAVRTQPALQLMAYDRLLALAGSAQPRPLTVAVLSTGYSAGIVPPEPAPEILPVENVVDGEGPEDANGHGTHVVSLMAALIPFREVRILPVKVLDSDGRGHSDVILRGVERALERDADILVAPVGGGDSTLGTAFANATQLGMVSIAAAGNNAMRPTDTGSVAYPAAAEGVLAVGAVGNEGTYAPFSPGPEGVDLFVPGVDILVVEPNGATRTVSGTSFSAVIAGAAIATAAAAPTARDLSFEELRNAVRASSRTKTEGGPLVLRADQLWTALAGG